MPFSKELSHALDRLDVVNAAAIPVGAEPAAARCGEVVEQVGHKVACTVRGDEVVARKRSPPVALGACHKYGLALLVLESYLTPLLFSLSTDSGTMPILSPGTAFKQREIRFDRGRKVSRIARCRQE